MSEILLIIILFMLLLFLLGVIIFVFIAFIPEIFNVITNAKKAIDKYKRGINE